MDEDEAAYLPSEDILEEYDLEDAVRPDSQDQDAESADDSDTEHDHVGHIQHPGQAPSAVFIGHAPAEAYAAAFCADIVCSGGEDDRIFFYRLSPDLPIQVVHEEQHDDSVSCIAVHEGRSLIASGWVDGVVRVYKHVAGLAQPISLLAELDGVSGEVLWIKWRADASELVAGGEDGAVWVWAADDDDDGSFTARHVFSGAGCPSTCGTFLAADSSCLAAGDDRGNVFVYDVDNGSLVRKMSVPGSVISICSHPTRKSFLIGTVEGSVFQGGATSSCQPCPGHSDAVEGISFYGNSFITASLDGGLAILDDQKMACRFAIRAPSGICCMQVSAAGTVVVGCEDGQVVSFDCRTGQPLGTFLSIDAPVLSISVSPDSKRMAVCNAAGQVSVYDLE